MGISKCVSTVIGLAAAAVLATAPGAQANWSSHIYSWTDGETSKTKWADAGYSQILFTGCQAENATKKSVVVKLWDYDALTANDYYGMKTFSKCFNSGSSVSNGEWTGLPSEPDFFFEADRIGQGGSCCLLHVGKVNVDTTKADS
ncbi:hypothetical protein ACIGJO_08575 [Streptomyces sp. NPDC079020]|uniref:hypothetical protein n=1 Tax=Streptomyces sp. NPDC079020 TaxID=3365722 RepID=UPI0037D11CE5